MNEMSVLFGIVLLIVLAIFTLMMYGDTNLKSTIFSFFLLCFASYLTIYAY